MRAPVPTAVLRVLLKVERGRRLFTPITDGRHDDPLTVRGLRTDLRLRPVPEITSAILLAIYVSAGRETAPTTLRT